MATTAKYNDKMDCTLDELMQDAEHAFSYAETKPDEAGMVEVKLVMPQEGRNRPFRKGKVTRADAHRIYAQFDPHGQLLASSNEPIGDQFTVYRHQSPARMARRVRR